MDQADNATRDANLATRMDVSGVTKSPQDTRRETKKAMRMRSIIKKIIHMREPKVFQPIGRGHPSRTLPHPLCISKRQKGLQSLDERL
jgi:uncharacterized iron-regulated protein